MKINLELKLLHKIAIWFLASSLVVFSLGGIVVNSLLNEKVKQETDHELKHSLKEYVRIIKKGVNHEQLNSRQVNIKRMEDTSEAEKHIYFTDTIAYHRPYDKLIQHRKLVTTRKIGDNWYQLSLYKVIIEPEDVLSETVSTLSLLFAMMVGLFILITLYISKWLLKPFHHTLGAIRKFNLQQGVPLNLPATRIREFTLLNTFINQMTEKATHDYRMLKEFTENASHEMQTPVAIARGKLEILMDSPNLKEEELQHLGSAYDALGKLIRLNRSLALLNKIENMEFSDLQQVDASQLLNKTIGEFSELMDYKNISMQKNIAQQVFIASDPAMFDILVSNLLKNAIQHNIENGKINIELTHEHLTISNSGKKLPLHEDEIFLRFRKDPSQATSLGLGLSIVKKICDVLNMEIIYTGQPDTHTFRVIF